MRLLMVCRQTGRQAYPAVTAHWLCVPAAAPASQLPVPAAAAAACVQTPGSQMELLIGMFGNLSEKQIEQMAKLMVSLTRTV